ncbi:MAG: hypothetical protein J6B76_03970 [Peptococcaceae bacterium]|nr:hypothetical protein [Peptococcaceae bacterium]
MQQEEHREHRDMQCAGDVRKMAQLRRFEQEFPAYGTVQWENGKPLKYLATMQAEKLYRYRIEQEKLGKFFTPIDSFTKRTLVPAGMEENITQATKYVLLGQMKQNYCFSDFFEKMQPLFRTEPNDNAYPLLLEEQSRIDGYFDIRKLQLFEGLVMMAYQAKVLSRDHFHEFLKWSAWVRRQMDDNPVAGDKFKRTFYGYVYEQNGKKAVIVDAKYDVVAQKREIMMINDLTVGPILEKTYFFAQFTMIKQLREDFKAWLMIEIETYFDRFYSIKSLSGVISKESIERVKQAVQHSPKAIQAVQYYENIWNMKAD